MSKERVKELILQVLEADYGDKGAATDTLVRATEENLSGFIETLDDEDKRVRGFAAWGIWQGAQNGIDISNAIPSLVKALSDPYINVEKAASWALDEIGEAAIPQLIAVLKNGNEIGMKSAREQLVKIGKPASPALMEVFQKEQKDYGTAGWHAFEALQEIKDSSLIPRLLELVATDEKNLRRKALSILEKTEPRRTSELKRLHQVGIEFKRNRQWVQNSFEHRCYLKIVQVHRKWGKVLSAKAGKFEKRFPAPKRGKPDSVKRVQRIQRVVG